MRSAARLARWADWLPSAESGSDEPVRFLRDHSIGQNYYPAGTTASTADVGGTLPNAQGQLHRGVVGGMIDKAPGPPTLLEGIRRTVALMSPEQRAQALTKLEGQWKDHPLRDEVRAMLTAQP
jgi:hypothetical protein